MGSTRGGKGSRARRGRFVGKKLVTETFLLLLCKKIQYLITFHSLDEGTSLVGLDGVLK
jgi:hypothetical protein